MNAYVVLEAMYSSEPANIQGRSVCTSCHEQSSLRIVVAELLYKNQILRFKLNQSHELAGQLRLAFDRVQAHLGSATELEGALNILSALLKPELEC